MFYISLNDLINDIRNNFYKIRNYEGNSPFCGVLGVPRSGMIPASIISEMMNIGLSSVNEFVEKEFDSFSHGYRSLNSINNEKKRILVVEDTCYNGYSLERTKKLLQPLGDKYEFVLMCVYLEGTLEAMKPDLFLRDIRPFALKTETKTALYEWNIMHNIQSQCIYDVDGIIFLDPPDELNTEQYVEYIKNPTPLFVPSTSTKLTFCTYRLVKYAGITKQSIENLGIKIKSLHMYNKFNYYERTISPWDFKSHIYSEIEKDKKLFIESDPFQAQKIFELTKKAVYCPNSNKLYSI